LVRVQIMGWLKLLFDQELFLYVHVRRWAGSLISFRDYDIKYNDILVFLCFIELYNSGVIL
jgi:hypothetical protein